MNLVSLLIGIGLSSLLIAASAEWFCIAKQAFRSHQSQIQAFDAVERGMMNFVRDIQSGGYRGTRSADPGFPINKLYSDVNPDYDYFREDRTVFGFIAKPGECYRKMPLSACQRVKENTPVLIVYHVAQKMNPLVLAMKNASAPLVLPADHGIHTNALVLITDAHQGDLWIANRIQNALVFHEHILKKNQSPSFSKAYSTEAEVVELQTVAYYLARPERFQEQNFQVRNFQQQNFQEQNAHHMHQNNFALFRDDFLQNAQELIPGVSHVEFEYGLQNPANKEIEYHKPEAMSEKDWAGVLVVRIHLGLEDAKIHHKIWTFDIALRNGIRPYFGFNLVDPVILDWDPYGNPKLADSSGHRKFF